MTITYRIANLNDAAAIADLHAKSWQQNYRGSLSDDYLDHQIETERLIFWTKRFQKASENEHIIIAEQNDQLIGFSCICLDEDPQWGALIDNLHVAKAHIGKGIGTVLMQKSMQWIKEQRPESGIYLWVLTNNTKGIKFYERLGGVKVEEKTDQMYDGSQVVVYRIAWSTSYELLPQWHLCRY